MIDPATSPKDITELLKKVRKIELRTRGIVRETFGGEYHSCFKGQGIDFEDFREYQHGDEVRSIDWNVTARMGTPFVKNFVEERELTVYICVDVSASGTYGSVELSKRELMAEIAAVMAFSAMQNKDKVGLILFTQDIELYLPPRKGGGHSLRIIREILHHRPSGQGTALQPVCDLLRNAVRRRSLVLMLSDFLFTENFSKILRGVSTKHDLVAFQISDPAELQLPSVGIVQIEDSETGEQVSINTSNPRLRNDYAKAAQSWQNSLDSTFSHLAVDHLKILTTQNYAPVLQRFFKSRDKRWPGRKK